jgi:hypothetical protein
MIRARAAETCAALKSCADDHSGRASCAGTWKMSPNAYTSHGCAVVAIKVLSCDQDDFGFLHF